MQFEIDRPSPMQVDDVVQTADGIRLGDLAPKFQKWKQQKANPGAATDSPSNASLMEAFRKGRTAVENWVDHEDNKTLVLHGDAAAIQGNPQLAAILVEYDKFGPTMRQKLQAHLAFMIDNRRKYYAAYNAMFGSSAHAP